MSILITGRMYFIYSLLLTIGFIVLLPRFLLDAFRHGKYVAGFRERLGFMPELKPGSPVIWIHCVSVGETQAARPLVKGLRKRFPDYRIVVSTITQTGQALAREVFSQDATRVFYFPFDWQWTVAQTLNVIRPAVVLVLETELWPNFLRECKRKQVPVALVNGRLSRQSHRRYQWISGFIRKVLRGLNLAIMQTEADADRLGNLGMDPGRMLVSGNIKFDADAVSPNDPVVSELRERFQLTSAPVILAASTHDPEETIVINSFLQVINKSVDKSRLIIAPRHPERFAQVAEILQSSRLRWTRRSATPSPVDQSAEVILLDSIGELHAVYSLASMVFVGGSLATTGGHNIIEPAAAGVPVIIGPHTYNFHSIVQAFVKAKAIIELNPMSDAVAISELSDIFLDLLQNPAGRKDLGERGRKLVMTNQGATERTLEMLEPMLSRAGTLTTEAAASA